MPLQLYLSPDRCVSRDVARPVTNLVQRIPALYNHIPQALAGLAMAVYLVSVRGTRSNSGNKEAPRVEQSQ